MARTLKGRDIVLTTLRSYTWDVRWRVGKDGKNHAQPTEVYVVTDDGYTVVPEGQKHVSVTLTAQQQTSLDNVFKAALVAAATREQVEPEPTP